MSIPPDPNALARAAAASGPDSQAAVRARYSAIIEMVWKKADVCPICGSSAWNLGDLVDVHVRHTPANFDQLAHLIGGVQPQVYVYVPVTCTYCGYTIFFHSGVLDVRDAEEVKAIPPLRFRKGQP
jgi:predicted nucleic-acid-binding Zn-ribbon protein